MDIGEHLKKGHSKELTMQLVGYIGNSQSKFDEFMPYFFHQEWRICQRASWCLGILCESYPELLLKWMPEILEALENPKHDAVVRNVLRAWQMLDEFPDEYEGQIYELCFEYIYDPKYPIAFKGFSMIICRKIALKYPELIPELIEVILGAMENGSAGIKSRGKKEVTLLSKISLI